MRQTGMARRDKATGGQSTGQVPQRSSQHLLPQQPMAQQIPTPGQAVNPRAHAPLRVAACTAVAARVRFIRAQRVAHPLPGCADRFPAEVAGRTVAHATLVLGDARSIGAPFPARFQPATIPPVVADHLLAVVAVRAWGIGAAVVFRNAGAVTAGLAAWAAFVPGHALAIRALLLLGAALIRPDARVALGTQPLTRAAGVWGCAPPVGTHAVAGAADRLAGA